MHISVDTAPVLMSCLLFVEHIFRSERSARISERTTEHARPIGINPCEDDRKRTSLTYCDMRMILVANRMSIHLELYNPARSAPIPLHKVAIIAVFSRVYLSIPTTVGAVTYIEVAVRPAAEHSFVQAKAPTCLASQVCTIALLTALQHVVPAHGHHVSTNISVLVVGVTRGVNAPSYST
jgi:hypothetical protein